MTALLQKLRSFSLLDIVGQRGAATAGAVSIALRGLLLFGKFLFIVVLARYTDAATLGIYALLVTIVTIAIYVIGLEIHTFTAREIVSDHMDGRGALHIQSHLVTVAGVFVLAVPITWWFTTWLDIAGKFSFALLAAIILGESFGQELGRYLMVLSRPVASNVLQFIRGAAWMPVPIAILLVNGPHQAINVVLGGWLIGTIGACIFGFWQMRSYLATLGRYRTAWFFQALISARHYLVVALLTQVQYYSDRFIIQRVLGESTVGVYSFYQSFANTMVAFVQTGVISVMMPRLLLAAKRDERTIERGVRRSIMSYAMALAVGVSLLLAIGMPFLLRWLKKDGYDSALSVFYILLVGNAILIAGLVVHLSLYARRRDAELMRVALIVVPIGLVANIVVVPAYGIVGAACTFLLVALLDLLIKARLLLRHVDKGVQLK